MPLSELIRLSEILIACTLIIESLEFIFIRRYFSDEGIWRWSIVRAEFQSLPWPMRGVCNLLLPYKPFFAVLLISLSAALILLIYSHPLLLSILLVSHILICMRWRGTYNGGSDYMVGIVLLGLTIAGWAGQQSSLAMACFWYIGIQSVLSYFQAGLVKLPAKEWWTGEALKKFLLSQEYAIPTKLRSLANKSSLTFVASILILAFETTAPLALLSETYALAFIGFGLCFHAFNSYALGLNRFFFAWLASYPSLYFCSKSFSFLLS